MRLMELMLIVRLSRVVFFFGGAPGAPKGSVVRVVPRRRVGAICL